MLNVSHQMKRILKLGFMAAVSIAGAAVVLVSLVIIGLDMNQYGIFPCKPLARWNAAVPVDHGGLIELSALEKRGPIHSYGFKITASYRSPQAQRSEQFGSWMHNSPEIQTCTTGSNVVVVSPDESMYVRSPDKHWKRFVMDFPGPYELAHSGTSRCCERIGISADDLTNIRSHLDEQSRQYDPSISIERFEPLTRTLTIHYHAKLSYEVSFRLSDDGTMLHLVDVDQVNTLQK